MDGKGAKWRKKIVKNFNRLRRVHERYGQTDRQTTDERAIIANVNVSSRSLISYRQVARTVIQSLGIIVSPATTSH